MTEIPEEARMLADQFEGVVKVMAPSKDYGPATKLLPTLEVETDPDTIIVTVDVSHRMCALVCLCDKAVRACFGWLEACCTVFAVADQCFISYSPFVAFT